MDKKFELILDGHKALDKKFDKKFDLLDEKVDSFRYETHHDISFLKLGQGVLKDQIKDFSINAQKNFEIIREYLARIDDEIQDLKKRLVAKADLDRLLKLEQRMARVELVIKKYYDENRN